MKSLSYLLFIALFGLICECKTNIQGKNLPAGISEAFKAKYPEAQKITWSSEDTGKFEVNFSLKNEKFSSLFSSNASWILTEKKIKPWKIPSTVLNTIQNGFGDYKIQSIKQVESASLGKYFSIKLKSGKEEKYLNLSYDGVILNNTDQKGSQN